MGMPDQDGMSLRAGQRLGFGQAGPDRTSLDDVVEENIPAQDRQSQTFSDGVTATIGDGHGIDEERALIGNRAEGDTQRPRITGETATHMIIKANRAGHAGHRPADAGAQITIAEINAQGVRSRIIQAQRFHRHMHQNIAATGLRRQGCRGGRLGIGQNGNGQRSIQGQHARGGGSVQADIINDQGDAWMPGNCAAGERCRNRQSDLGRGDGTGGRQPVQRRNGHSASGPRLIHRCDGQSLSLHSGLRQGRRADRAIGRSVRD